MRYTFLSPKCKLEKRPEFEHRKCFTRSKGLAKLSKCSTLQKHLKCMSKLKESSMCAKSSTKFVLSPLLTEAEKNCVIIGKNALGYTCNTELIHISSLDCTYESSSDSCSSSEDEEFIFS